MQAFLDGRIGFLAIAEVVERVLDRCGDGRIADLPEVFDCDARGAGAQPKRPSSADGARRSGDRAGTRRGGKRMLPIATMQELRERR